MVSTLSLWIGQVDIVLMQRLQSVWREFEASLAEGAQFVETQTPLKAQGLQESISVCAHIYLASLVGSVPWLSPPELIVHLFIRRSCLALPSIFGFDSAS